MRNDVFVTWNVVVVADEPFGGVLDSMKWPECRLGNAHQHRVAVVRYGKYLQRMSDKCSGGGIIWQRTVFSSLAISYFLLFLIFYGKFYISIQRRAVQTCDVTDRQTDTWQRQGRLIDGTASSSKKHCPRILKCQQTYPAAVSGHIGTFR